MASTTDDRFVHVGSRNELRETGPTAITIDGHSIGLFYHDDTVHAVANQCPHMGFPLTSGTVDDGILTCHWHHARFELTCGDTFDPWADDVPTYPVDIRDDEIWILPEPQRDETPIDHWQHRLEDGLKENLSLVIAKAVIGLSDEDISPTIPIRTGVKFGTTYRENGWGSGLTTLGVMANLLNHISPDDHQRALHAGLITVANDCAGEPPFFAQHPLRSTTISPDRLTNWFQENIEVRDADGAERVLRAAIKADLPQPALIGMLVAAGTDHLYLDSGHTIDFINKAIETLDHIGWDHADAVLPSLVPNLAAADRAEEHAAWRKPTDLTTLLWDTYNEVPSLVETQPDDDWTESPNFLEILLGDDPHAIIHALRDAITNGATAHDLATVVSYAATKRIAQFGTSNEFSDWTTVHHTASYANAIRELTTRTTTWRLYRGVFDAAMNIYLDRFLNIPPATIPDSIESPRPPDDLLTEIETTFETEGTDQIQRAGRLTAEYIDATPDITDLKHLLGHVLIREDAGFHPRQNLETAFTQYDRLTDSDRQRVTIIAAARYLAAHTPTRREREQTYDIAARLNRGEKIHEH